MLIVFLTALGVGGATVLGAVLGFLFQKIPNRFNDMVLSFAAGVMLAAAVIGLAVPSVELGGRWAVPIAAAGVFSGALVLNLMDRAVPRLRGLSGVDRESRDDARLNRVLLFVAAIAIHNLPEGIAAGVGFGTGSEGEAITIAAGIALQNVPEGMVIIAPMLAAGIGAGRTFVIALFTGVVEVVGTFLGYFAVTVSSAVLPFALAFAGGTMLYVISDEMIPETHAHDCPRGATYALLAGFCLMLAMDYYID